MVTCGCCAPPRRPRPRRSFRRSPIRAAQENVERDSLGAGCRDPLYESRDLGARYGPIPERLQRFAVDVDGDDMDSAGRTRKRRVEKVERSFASHARNAADVECPDGCKAAERKGASRRCQQSAAHSPVKILHADAHPSPSGLEPNIEWAAVSTRRAWPSPPFIAPRLRTVFGEGGRAQRDRARSPRIPKTPPALPEDGEGLEDANSSGAGMRARAAAPIASWYSGDPLANIFRTRRALSLCASGAG